MAKGPIPSTADAGEQTVAFTKQNVDRAMQATNYGMDWMRQLAGHGLDQSKVIFDSFIGSARASAETIDRQAVELRERSLALVGQSVSNGFDFAHRFLQARDAHEVIQLQSEFLSRQARVLADQAKEWGQVVAQDAEEVGRQALDQAQSAVDQVRRKA